MQPPSGGCVLKLLKNPPCGGLFGQPPSGGCVLKHQNNKLFLMGGTAAAFGRLCVETALDRQKQRQKKAAAFGRLCVETS